MVLILAQCVITITSYQRAQQENFPKLSLTQQQQLLDMIIDEPNVVEEGCKSYAISLLIASLLRESDPKQRDIALELLQSGKYKGDLWGSIVDLTFKNHKYLVDVPYIEFAGSKFTGTRLENINLSGQYLFGITAERCIFKDVKLRWSCLEGSNFNEAKLEDVDANGSTFFNANLSHLTAKHTNFKECIFAQCNFQYASSKKCYFNRADFNKAKLAHATFKKATLLEVQNLTQDQIELTSCLDCFYPEDIKRELVNKYNVKSVSTDPAIGVTPRELFTNMAKNERVACPNESPSWPKFNWNHDPEWNDPEHINQQSCILENNDHLYKIIDHYTHLTSDHMTYIAMKYEPARLYHAYSRKEELSDLWNAINQERKKGPPTHRGEVASISIHAILVNKNPKLWRQFQNQKTRIREELQHSNIKNPLIEVKWHYRDEPQFPVLDPSVGECWLFHGTSLTIAKSIFRNGFTTKYAKKKPFGIGYGALGRGIYLADAFPKAAAYVLCPICGFNQCDCKDKKPNLENCKVVILSRVLLGSVYKDTNKNRKGEEGPPLGSHSSWGPNQAFDQESCFDCNEFCVPETQIYPEFCIFYNDNKLQLENTPDDQAVSFLPTPHSWKKNYRPKLAFDEFVNSFEKHLNDYYRLIHNGSFEQRILFLTGPLKSALNELNESQQPPKLVLHELNNNCQAEVGFLTQSLNNTTNILIEKELLRLELQVDYYFHKQEWSEAIFHLDKILENETRENCQVIYHLMRAVSYQQLQQRDRYILDINIALKIDAIITEKYLDNKLFGLSKEVFVELSLRSLFEEGSTHHNSIYYSQWLDCVALWLSQMAVNEAISIDAWEYYYWLLQVPDQREKFKECLDWEARRNYSSPYAELILNRIDNLPDEKGIRQGAITRRAQWQKQFLGLTINEETDVEIRWLEENEFDASYKSQKAYCRIPTILDENGQKTRSHSIWIKIV